jgi:DNA-binding HxlR family transcriptional regulator
VPRNVRTYDHFCLVARALERVGDRWSLLVIRDLLAGPKRFTDLIDRLGGITPKTLSLRLRELEDAGILAADREPGRREVWYHLTPAGAELEPVIDGLGQWGLQHAWRWPQPGEPLHAEHLLRSVVQAIELAADDHQPVRWHFRLDSGDYLVESDGRRWSLTAPSPAPQNPAAPSPAPPSQAGPADVTITAPTRALTAFIFAGSDRDVDIAGAAGPVQRFRRLITAIATVAAGQPENIGQPGNTGQPENGSRALRA